MASYKATPNRGFLQKKVGFAHLLIGVTLLLLIFSVLLNAHFVYYGRTGFLFWDKIIKLVQPSVDPYKCKYHDTPAKSVYLDSYTVKPGDTILSIAKTQLHDDSRAEELLILNHDKYPFLTMKNPFVEIGWTILLPPKAFSETSGNIAMVRGVIRSIEENDNWSIAWGTDPVSGDLLYNHYYVGEGTFESKSKSDYKVGDCVSILSDYGRLRQNMVITSQ